MATQDAEIFLCMVVVTKELIDLKKEFFLCYSKKTVIFSILIIVTSKFKNKKNRQEGL
jgi:hypothetical protein